MLFDAGMVKLFSFSFYLSGWCCVDIVEESLKIVTWEGAVHLLVGACNGFVKVVFYSDFCDAYDDSDGATDFTEDGGSCDVDGG